MLEESNPRRRKSPFDSRRAVIAATPTTFVADAEWVLVREIARVGVSPGAELVRAAAIGAFGSFCAGLTIDTHVFFQSGGGDPGVKLSPDPFGEARDEATQKFIDEHGLDADVRLAVELARKSFPSSNVVCQLESDPEAGDEWLVVEVAIVGADASAVVAGFDELMRAWVTETTPEQRDRITLSYSVQ